MIDYVLERLPIRTRDPWERGFLAAPALAGLSVAAVLAGAWIQAWVFEGVAWAEGYGGILGTIAFVIGIVPLALAWFLLILVPSFCLVALPHVLTRDLDAPGVDRGRLWRLRVWALFLGVAGIVCLIATMTHFGIGERPG